MGAFTLEIHDVTPGLAAEVFELREALAAAGCAPPTLLVVPEYEDAEGTPWPLESHPSFVDWIRRERDQGAEVVLHGLTHRAPAPPPDLRGQLMHRFFSRGQAEFAHLDGDEARRRLLRGRQILAACDLDTRGFIAPAWQQSAAARREVIAQGFDYTAFLWHVERLSSQPRKGQRIDSPALTFAAGCDVVDRGKRVVMAAIEGAALLRRAPLLRLALHPEDARRRGLLAHIVQRAKALAARREQRSYGQLCEQGGAPC